MLLRDLIVEANRFRNDYEYCRAKLLDLNGDTATIKFLHRPGRPQNIPIIYIRLPPKWNDPDPDFEGGMQVEVCSDIHSLDGWRLDEVNNVLYNTVFLCSSECRHSDEVRMRNRNPTWNVNNFKHAEIRVAERFVNDFQTNSFVDMFCLEAGAFYAKFNRATAILDVIFFNKRAIIPPVVRNKYAAPVAPPRPTLPSPGPAVPAAAAAAARVPAPASTNFPSIASILINELECPVCINFMKAPIMLCVTGHSLCQTCQSRLQNCPICQQRFTTTRNFMLETVVEKLAAYQLQPVVAPQPRPVQPPRPVAPTYHCQIQSCNWSGEKVQLISHWCAHTNQRISLDSEEFAMDLGPRMRQPHIIRAFDEYFWYKGKVTAGNVFWTVQYIGPNENANRYSYKIGLGRKKSVVLRGRCQSLNLTDQVLFGNANHCLYVGLDILDVYIKNNRFYFTITILKP